MGSASQILRMTLIIFILILFLNPQSLMARAPLNATESPTNVLIIQEHYWGENNVSSSIRKVSGEDETEEMKELILEKFRVLFGLNSIRSPKNGNLEHGFSSPSPALAPSPVTMVPASPRGVVGVYDMIVGNELDKSTVEGTTGRGHRVKRRTAMLKDYMET
ncbi:hypothetical protein NE237_008564 [Protea cynaroides]|uniref:Uncharacterized protein n=1 Tax=Protea cynaroides TaxID=273540 RepID=A0A9Q0KWZ5_9MAGN|nr:hypothetical protein NE237_008564 [Protea cynaroides]